MSARIERAPLTREALAAIVVAVLLSGPVPSHTARQKTGPNRLPEEELMQLNRQWVDAVLHKDIEALDRILAEDYIVITELGEVVDKRRVLDENRSPNLAFTDIENDEVRVRIFGDAAVVTGRLRVKGRAGGKPFSGPSRYTDVYVKRSGRWVAVAEHVSMVASQQ